MRIVAYKISNTENGVCIEESTGETITSKNIFELLDFICEPFQTKDEIEDEGVKILKVCWDLNASVAPLLSLLGRENCELLQKKHKIKLKEYQLFYIPDKIFCARFIPPQSRNGELIQLDCKLYDISQYYTEKEEPQTINDLLQLGKDLLKTLQKMYLKTTKLTSPVAIYEDAVLSKMNLPKIWDLPKPVAEYANECSRRLWIETYQIGFFKDAVSLDIVSSFPSAARDLIDIRQCEWIRSPKWQPKACYGYCRGKITIYDNVKVSPIMYRNKQGELLTPTGQWVTYLTKEEIEFINKWGIGEFEIYDAWWAIPTVEKLRQPLKLVLDNLLVYKSLGGLQSTIAKRISTGNFYGKFGQELDDEVGDYWNPVWFAEISTQIRLKVAEFIYENNIQDNIIHIGVDGIILDTIIPAQGNAVGQWKLAGISDCLSISSGLVYMDDKKPKGLSLQDILSLIEEHPQKNIYTKTFKKVVTLGDALNSKFEDLGKIRDTFSTINLITMQHDRVFNDLPLTGGQLMKNIYKSIPQHIG
jgi:hypothetical protein